MYYKEKLSRERRVRNNYRRVCHLEREIFPEKVTTSGQRSEAGEEVSCVGVWGKDVPGSEGCPFMGPDARVEPHVPAVRA